MTPFYNPKDWYWIVGGDASQVYSSKSGDYVPSEDATYRAWVASGGVPSRVDSNAELGEILAPHNVRPVNAAVLDGYTNLQSSRLATDVVAKVLFWAVNEIRVLKGQQPVTAPQFRAFLKGLM